MTELQQILENSKLTAEKIKANLLHPVLNTTDYKPREFFDEITEVSDNYFNRKSAIRMIGLAGLRGVGKTTLLWQTADYIYKNYTQNIYFFHLADLKNYNIGVREIHKGFEKYFANGELWSYKKQIIFLFDEVHEDPNWASDLKILYDLFRSVFVIATGSSALLLQSTADLVTRMLIQHVYPLNFSEYIGFTHSIEQLKETTQNLQTILLQSDNATELFQQFKKIQTKLDDYNSKIDNIDTRILNYIVYHNITRFSLEQNKEHINRLISDLIRRVIYEDIPKLTKQVPNLKNAEKILYRIAASDEINLQSLSQTIGISQKEINDNLGILEKAELLNVLYPYGGIDSKINKTKKYFFMSPSIRKAVLSPLKIKEVDNNLYAKMLEDTVVLYLKRIFRDWHNISFSSAKGQKNPDLIIETIDKPILLEIGINKNTTKQIVKSRIKYKYGIVINSKTDKIELHNDIVIIPLKYFLLL